MTVEVEGKPKKTPAKKTGTRKTSTTKTSGTKKATGTKKPTTRKKKTEETPANGTTESAVKVKDIIVDRIIKKITETNRLPWQQPFKGGIINWSTMKEYRGINRFLLPSGEYITLKQLVAYNKTLVTKENPKGGTYLVPRENLKDYEIVVFYNVKDDIISEQEAQDILASGSRAIVFKSQKYGVWVKRRFTLRYYKVYDIKYVKNENGEGLPPHFGRSIFMEHTPAQKIVDDYTKRSGVKIFHDVIGEAYYRNTTDSVHLPKGNYMKAGVDGVVEGTSTEPYYRTLFHELVHSTGTKARLNRDTLKDYHNSTEIRSKEELIAEAGALLLATEAGFQDDSPWAKNSMEYIHSWVGWMKENVNDVVSGLQAAEKASNYILTGETPNYETNKTETSEDGNEIKKRDS